MREALFGDVHAGHDLDAGDQGGLVALQLGRHGRLVQDAVNAVADAQLVLRRLEMDVRGAVLEGLPYNLVDKLDDAGFLVAFGDLLVLDQQLQRLVVLGDFVECFRAHAVELLEAFLDFGVGGQRESHRDPRVELDGAEHGAVKGVADGDLQLAVLELSGKDRVLEGDLGGDALAGFRGHVRLGDIDKRPAQRLGQFLEEGLLRQALLPRDKREQRVRGAGLNRHAPGFVPVVKLPGRGEIVPLQQCLNRNNRHDSVFLK